MRIVLALGWISLFGAPPARGAEDPFWMNSPRTLAELGKITDLRVAKMKELCDTLGSVRVLGACLKTTEHPDLLDRFCKFTPKLFKASYGRAILAEEKVKTASAQITKDAVEGAEGQAELSTSARALRGEALWSALLHTIEHAEEAEKELYDIVYSYDPSGQPNDHGSGGAPKPKKDIVSMRAVHRSSYQAQQKCPEAAESLKNMDKDFIFREGTRDEGFVEKTVSDVILHHELAVAYYYKATKRAFEALHGDGHKPASKP